MSDTAASIMSEALTTTTWVVAPQGFFSRHFKLVREGQVVATLQMAMFTEACEFMLGGHEFAIRRQSLWKDAFEFTCDGAPVCSVTRKFWSRRFEITVADQLWTLQRAGWFTRAFQLLRGEQDVGTIRPTGFFTSQRIAQFSDSVPPPIQVLAIFLVLVVSRRQQQSAGS